MNSLDDKKPSIFNFYFFVGLTLIIASMVEVLLNDLRRSFNKTSTIEAIIKVSPTKK